MIRSVILACAICALGAVGCVATSSASDETAVAQNIDSCFLYDCRNVDVFGHVRCIAIPLCFVQVNIDIDCPECRPLNDFERNVLIEDLNNSGDANILNPSQILNRAEQTVMDDYLNKFNIPVSHSNISTCTPTIGACI